MGDDLVRIFLRERGAADHVIEGGLEALVHRWEHTAEAVEHGHVLGFDDYLNDLDGRQLLEEARVHADAEQWSELAGRVEAADARLRAATVEVKRCLWGTATARRQGYRREIHWWFWRGLPTDAG